MRAYQKGVHMGLETKKFAVAAAQTAGVVYVVCAAVVALFPAASLKLLGWLAHARPESLVFRTVTPAGFILGLLQIIIYSYVIAWVFAKIYNRSLAVRQ